MNKKGFTLMELMVVVAIIGILSAVVVPSFKKYVAKSRSAEAHIGLASIYTAENSAFADWNTYVSCLWTIGVPGTMYATYGVAALNTQYAAQARTRYYNVAVHNDDGDDTWGNAFVRSNNLSPNCLINLDGPLFGYLAWRSSASCKGKTTNGGAAWAIIHNTVVLNQSEFTAVAYGWIGLCPYPDEDAGNLDIWSIDQSKKLVHVQVGY